MSWQVHTHREGADLIPADVRDEIEAALTRGQAYEAPTPSKVRRAILDELYLHGWPRRVKVSARQSRLSISSLKRRIGLCAQFGNFARTYADLLKLEALKRADQIDVGALIVPTEAFSRELGSNLARFGRITRELEYFHDVLECPLVVYGLSKN
jgi:hypothetical protein